MHVNDNAANSDHSGKALHHIVSILVVNVYVNSLEEWLLRGSFLPCYKKLKGRKVSKGLKAVSFVCDFYKIQF